ncbi:sensor histidine kinase [Psychromonas sp. Urea-02u-13]|uniref:sensor histidine kinase n=1 Tax=Psychromonas sp. Urea-02u-13 TaxID=2058326 RepID=UPI000C31C334|nr:HAMP domain-containing sensor histidine kinase [Psychromonas sp. Urea-02u-13]PKG37378.1 hypothetical protein CXF74_19140 [Psychromonas sp. Urea-02u-13]
MPKQQNNQQSDALNWSDKLNYLALTLTLLAVLFSCFSYFSMQALQKASENRYHSYLLTEQLRLSSDQLTQMARAHAVTGEQKYLLFFKKILAIRNGSMPRPVNYHRVYWDILVPENGQAPFIDGTQYPLQQLMAQAGFTQQEFEQLKKSQQASDKLTDLEFLAFNQVASALSEQTDYSQSALKNSALALLYSEEYLQAKSEIMSHINTFYRLQEERTDAEVQSTAQTHNVMTTVTLISFIALLIVLVFNFRLKQKVTLQFISMLKEEVDLQTKKIQEQNVQLTNSMEIMESTKVQLVESEKMASLGSLVAGVAHEINTPIGIGITAITSLQEEVKKLGLCIENNRLSKSSLANYLDLFEKISDLVLVNLSRVGNLVKSFKQVSVDQSYDEIRHLELKEYVQAVVDSILPNYKYPDIKINVNIDSYIICDVYPGALSQVVSNLVINAFVHAFDKEKKGEIIISATQQGDLVALNIKDNGQGMSEQDRIKAFEPFFTTKRNKGGTGLGLHIVYNLVTQKLLGEIHCESEQGNGSEFKMTFPRQGKAITSRL